MPPSKITNTPVSIIRIINNHDYHVICTSDIVSTFNKIISQTTQYSKVGDTEETPPEKIKRITSSLLLTECCHTDPPSQ